MNAPDRRSYTAAERRDIILEARRVARELLTKLEELALIDGVNDEAVAMVTQLKEQFDGEERSGDVSG